MKGTLILIITVFNSLSIKASVVVVKHMAEAEKCIICHRADSPKQLLFRDGKKIPAQRSDLLCGQCHGIKHLRWEDGRHGKVTGSWQGGRGKRQTCIACHDPHSPKINQIEAKAPPQLRGHVD